MKQFLILSRVQLRALLAAFRVGGSRKKAVSGRAALLVMAVVCLYVSGVYSFALGGQLAEAGALELLLLLMPAMAAVAGLVFTAFAAQGVVFGGRDTDLLLSMPVSAFAVLLSKLTALYAENLVFCGFLILPAGAAWLRFGGGGGAAFVVRLVAGTLFLALLPTVLSLAAGFLLSWLGGRAGNKKAVNLLLFGVLIAAVFFLAFQFNMGVSAIAAGAVGAGGALFAGWGLPFQMFQRGVCGDWETLVMFGLFTLAPALLVVWLFAKNYQQVLTGLQSHGKRPAYRVGRLRASGRRKALLRKESARYFGTPIYLFNTGIGLLLLLAAGIAVAVMGGNLQEQLAAAGMRDIPLLISAAAVTGFLLSTVAVTGSSISLEGENFWILKEAPVSARDALNMKAAFQLLLCGPCVVICAAGLAFGLKMTPAQGAVLAAFGLAFAAFTAPFGLAVNLLFPKLDAINDTVVVKQSLAAMLATFGGMGAAVGCAAAAWGLAGAVGETLAVGGCAAVLLVGSAAVFRWLHTRGAVRFEELYGG